MKLAATLLDMVLGVDTHLVNIMMPGPVPTPVPLPFAGIIVRGSSTVLVSSLGAANTTSIALNSPPHIPAPGVSFVIPPSNDALLPLGCVTVLASGAPIVRDAERALSCNDPVRLPTSVVRVMGNATVLIGGPTGAGGGSASSGSGGSVASPVTSGARGAGGQVFAESRANPPRVAFGSSAGDAVPAAGGSSGAAGSSERTRAATTRARSAPETRRSQHPTERSTLTGHPVDVATGRVVTSRVDFELGGPLRYRFERRYDSSLSFRKTSLGYGWWHPFEQTIRHGVLKRIWRADDGREIEFDLSTQPSRRLVHGESVDHPFERATLHAWDGERYTIETRDGLLREFAPVRAPGGDEIKLVRIRTRDKLAISLSHDALGRLALVTDSGGREIRFEHDAEGRLVRVMRPSPDGEGAIEHVAYAYDEAGDLAGSRDALGAWDRMSYVRHLLVEETDRTGLAFHFQYDGLDPSARCIRTWGSHGIFDHEIVYGPSMTAVTDSLGRTVTHRIDRDLRVIETLDAAGGSTKRSYDPDFGTLLSETDPTGAVTTYEHDARGNLVRIAHPDGTESRAEYKNDLLREVRDAMGGRWRYSYDSFGRLVRAVDPLDATTRYEYRDGLLARIDEPSGASVTFDYDARSNPTRVAVEGGHAGIATTSFRHDARGRTIERRDARGAVERIRYDACDRVVEREREGDRETFAYDGEGNVVEWSDRFRRARYRYTGVHRLASIEEADTTVRFSYDTEDQLVEVTNELGESYRFVFDARGLPSAEIGFDGRTTKLEHDAAGRLARVQLPSGKTRTIEYDARGRAIAVRYGDGSARTFRYRLDGLLSEASNGDQRVRLERDARGRVVREWQGESWIGSSYDPAGARTKIDASDGHSQRIARDPLGIAHAIETAATASAPLRIELARDVLGAEVERRAHGASVVIERDAAGRPVLRSARFGDRDSHELRCAWAGSRLEGMIDSEAGKISTSYDPRGRLQTMTGAGHDEHRAFDRAGNLYLRADLRDRAYARGGRLETTGDRELAWDLDGNLSSITDRDGRVTTFHHRADGLLGAIDLPDGGRVEMRYDALARRIAKTVSRRRDGELVPIATTRWTWDADVPLRETVHADGEIVRDVVWVFAPESFAPLARLDRQNERADAIFTDALGAPSEIANGRGELAWRASVGADGRAIEHLSSSVDCPFRFPGQYADPETGLHYNRHRYYAPELGLYERVDPIGLEGGLRLYGYVADPLTQIDPLGLSCATPSAVDRRGAVSVAGGRSSGLIGADGPADDGLSEATRAAPMSRGPGEAAGGADALRPRRSRAGFLL